MGGMDAFEILWEGHGAGGEEMGHCFPGKIVCCFILCGGNLGNQKRRAKEAGCMENGPQRAPPCYSLLLLINLIGFFSPACICMKFLFAGISLHHIITSHRCCTLLIDIGGVG